MPSGYVIWLNGAFGVGKTTVARALASRLPDALILDPEDIGRMLHHFTLAASPKVIRRRLLWRLSAPWATRWALRRVERCTRALRSPLFATHVDTENRSVPDVVTTIHDVLASDADRPTARGRTPLVWLHPSPPATELDDLVARVTDANVHGEIEAGPSVGGEAW